MLYLRHLADKIEHISGILYSFCFVRLVINRGKHVMSLRLRRELAIQVFTEGFLRKLQGCALSTHLMFVYKNWTQGARSVSI